MWLSKALFKTVTLGYPPVQKKYDTLGISSASHGSHSVEDPRENQQDYSQTSKAS